ncbi:OmpP1/FadL family transporter [Bizionia myxarmorum]|uniref:Transporter n=1 Tax=Bizionia myxarmorum TaxID=291186 RepID=A0A5D0RDN7_9FLAO|nr:outer membrane protein transport protein [Bizionia myxarmorum]TYB79443.1 transporter [Bizionia myxarmorum]
MKKVILLSVAILTMSQIYAQDITDALRYSQDNIQGTARFRALSGAFGALGGDMSAVGINPAGSAVFNAGHISMSLSNNYTKNKTGYYDGFSETTGSSFDLNQTGAAFVFYNTNPNSAWKKFTIGAAYDKISNYDDNWFAYGTNPNRSIGSYFTSFANGLRLDEISGLPGESYSQAYSEIGGIYGYANQQAFLGYESYILQPLTNDDANTAYSSNIAPGNYYQEYSYASRGYNGKFTFNVGTQLGEKLYFGINLNSHFVNYERSTFLNENNSNTGSVVSKVRFENNLFTTGSGFSFQLGTIYKVTESLRAGLSYNSPTWFTINEESSQSISTLRDDSGVNVSQVVNPYITNIYPSYRLQSPGKFTGSLAYVFGTYGLISFDYSLKDYGNTQFKPTSDGYFNAENNRMSNLLTSASTYKIGGEVKFNNLSVRGGYRFEESPYKNASVVGDINGYSVGLGYNFGSSTKLDLTYDQAQQNNETQLYNVGLVDRANIDSRNSNITLTLSFNL